MTMLRKIWSGWKKVGRAIGDVLARIVLTLLYFTIVLPFGLITRLGRDPLELKSKSEVSWHKRTTRNHTIDDGRRLS